MPVWLIVGIITGFIAAAIASAKGRSVVAWFFVGFLIGIIGIIIVACMPNLKEVKSQRLQAESERRRLREMLRQERAKNESFRDYSMSRIDAHDQALGIDTRPQQALPGASQPGLPSGPASQLPNGASQGPLSPASQVGQGQALWYYDSRGQSTGPVSETELRQLLRTGVIDGNVLLWTEGLSEWTLAKNLETFRSEIIG